QGHRQAEDGRQARGGEARELYGERLGKTRRNRRRQGRHVARDARQRRAPLPEEEKRQEPRRGLCPPDRDIKGSPPQPAQSVHRRSIPSRTRGDSARKRVSRRMALSLGRGRSIATMSRMRPGRGVMTTTTSESSTASLMLCVTKSTVLRLSLHSVWSAKPIRSRVMTSSAPKGSSIKIRGGFSSIARQIDARCCIPPESSCG